MLVGFSCLYKWLLGEEETQFKLKERVYLGESQYGSKQQY